MLYRGVKCTEVPIKFTTYRLLMSHFYTFTNLKTGPPLQATKKESYFKPQLYTHRLHTEKCTIIIKLQKISVLVCRHKAAGGIFSRSRSGLMTSAHTRTAGGERRTHGVHRFNYEIEINCLNSQNLTLSVMCRHSTGSFLELGFVMLEKVAVKQPNKQTKMVWHKN